MKIRDGLGNRVAPLVRLIVATYPERNTEKIKFRSRYNIMAIKNQRFFRNSAIFWTVISFGQKFLIIQLQIIANYRNTFMVFKYSLLNI